MLSMFSSMPINDKVIRITLEQIQRDIFNGKDLNEVFQQLIVCSKIRKYGFSVRCLSMRNREQSCVSGNGVWLMREIDVGEITLIESLS